MPNQLANALLALLAERLMQAGQPTAYLCEEFKCNLPITEPEQLERQL
jgi:uncharacterized protein YyaL (SSP411 family)